MKTVILAAALGALGGFGAAALVFHSGACASRRPPEKASSPKRAGPDTFDRAATLQDQGKDADAVLIYEELLKRDPDDLDARFNLAAACENLGRLDRAFEEYRKVLERDPERLDALSAAAGLSLDTGHLETSLQLHRRLAQLREGDLRDLHKTLGRIEAELQKRRGKPADEPVPDDLIDDLLKGE